MNSSPDSRPVLIVGGGISGLSAAYYLGKAGIPTTLIEKAARLGGVIETATEQGCVIEGGPDSFLAAKPWALELIKELGLGGEVISSNDHQRVTYVVRRGRLVPLPDGLMMMIPTKVWPVARSPLLGWGTKIRMGMEYFRKPAPRPDDCSVGDFVREHYGAEAVEYLAEPLLSGVYGGDPDALSLKSTLPRFAEMEAKYGSLTRAMLSAPKPAGGGGSLFQTLRSGLGSLVKALEPHARSRIQGQAETIEERRVRVNGEWVEGRAVVVACPAHEAGRLLGAVDGEAAASLAAIPYTSSTTVALGYRRAELRHPLNGFGFLVPRAERGAMVACTWVGTKFPNRVPDSMALLRCFVTGEPDVEAIRGELRRLMGVGAEPAFVRVSRWPRSMAQYTVGHAARIALVEARLARHPWLQVAGNAYSGIGIPDCVRTGKQAAARIAGG